MAPTPDDAAKLEWTETSEVHATFHLLAQEWPAGPRRLATPADLARLGYVPRADYDAAIAAERAWEKRLHEVTDGEFDMQHGLYLWAARMNAERDRLKSALRTIVDQLDNGSELGESASIEECLGAVEIVREHVGHLTSALQAEQAQREANARAFDGEVAKVKAERDEARREAGEATTLAERRLGHAHQLQADIEAEQAGRLELRQRLGARADETMHGFICRLADELASARGRVAELEAERDYWKREHSLKCYDADHFQMMRDERDALASQLEEANAMGRKQAAMLRRADRVCSKMHMASASMIPGRLEAWANELSEALTLDTAEATVEPSPQPPPVAHPAAEPVADVICEKCARDGHSLCNCGVAVEPATCEPPKVGGISMQAQWLSLDGESCAEPCCECGWLECRCVHWQPPAQPAEPSAPVKPSADGPSVAWLDDANFVYWKGYETANGAPPENHQTAHLCGVMAVLEYGIGRGRANAKAGADVGEVLAKFPRCQAVQCEAHARLRLRNLLNYCQEHADYLKSPDNRSLLEPVPWLAALEAAESLVKP
jgi:hypothetical protein